MERAAVYTNTVPAAFMRAPGDVQIMFAIESMIDVVAHELRIDPLEFRLEERDCRRRYRYRREPGDRVALA